MKNLIIPALLVGGAVALGGGKKKSKKKGASSGGKIPPNLLIAKASTPAQEDAFMTAALKKIVDQAVASGGEVATITIGAKSGISNDLLELLKSIAISKPGIIFMAGQVKQDIPKEFVVQGALFTMSKAVTQEVEPLHASRAQLQAAINQALSYVRGIKQ